MNETADFDRDLLQELIKNLELDLIIVSSRHNLRYLTGGYCYPLFQWDSFTRGSRYLPFLGMPAGRFDESFFIGRPGENLAAKEFGLWVEDCVEAKSINIASAVETLAGVLHERGFARSRIGFEMADLPSEAYVALGRALPGVEFADITDPMDTMRAVKTEREIEIVRKGTLENLAGVTTALKGARPGMSTSDVANTVAEEFGRRGLHFLYALVCAGPSYFRIASDKRRLENGRILHIDSGGLTEGYVVETCRTGSLGSPSPQADELLGLCTELERYMLPYFRPGAVASEIQKAADSYIEGLGVPFEGKFIAHGIGMVHHEKPVVSRTSSEVLKAGMVLSLEMEFRSPDTGHVKTEDMVVIRTDDCEILSPGGSDWTVSRTPG